MPLGPIRTHCRRHGPGLQQIEREPRHLARHAPVHADRHHPPSVSRWLSFVLFAPAPLPPLPPPLSFSQTIYTQQQLASHTHKNRPMFRASLNPMWTMAVLGLVCGLSLVSPQSLAGGWVVDAYGCVRMLLPPVWCSRACVCVFCVIFFSPPSLAPSSFHQQTPNAMHTTIAAHRRGAVPDFPYQRRLHGQP